MLRFSDFILNETLKTHEIDFSIENIDNNLKLQRYDFNIKKNLNNTFYVELLNFDKVQNFYLYLSNLESLIVNRHGWFPSKMKLTNFSGMVNIFPYDEEYIISHGKYLTKIKITYEAKDDTKVEVPEKLYHLSIQEYEKSVINKGLIPKSKSKLTKHLDRIYLCKNKSDCINLIDNMNLYYSNKSSMNKKNTKWIIYEIDTTIINFKIRNDPNYVGGFFTVDNINKDYIKIIDKEKL